MVLGSDVPLTEDILKKPITFLRTFREHIELVGRRRMINRDVSNTSTSPFYTVPRGKTSYLMFAHMSVTAQSGLITDVKANLRLDSASEFILVTDQISGQNSDVTYNGVLEMDQLQTLTASSGDSAIDGHISIIVYEVDKKIG